MPDVARTGRWNRRAGDLFSKGMCFALGGLAAFCGFVLYLESRLRQPLWPIVMIAIALWLWFQGGPLLFRLAEKRGLFGRIHLKAGRLNMGKGPAWIDTARPFSAEARVQRSTIVRKHNLVNPFSSSYSSSARKVKTELRVLVLTLALEQDGRRYFIAADGTNRRRDREADLEGVYIRHVPIQAPEKKLTARLRPADLADLLRLLQKTAGYSAAITPIPSKPPEDPRQALYPAWKTAMTAAGVLILILGAAVLAFNHFQAEQQRRVVGMKKTALAEKKRREAEAGAIVGRRVMIPARGDARMFGKVVEFEMVDEVHYDPDYRIEWRARLKVKIDELYDPEGGDTPGEAELAFRHADDRVRIGSLVEVSMDEARFQVE